MASQVTIDLASVVSLILECIFYGMSLILFGMTFRVLFPLQNSASTYIMFPSGVIFLLCSSMHVTVNGFRVVNALITHPEMKLLLLGNSGEMTFLFGGGVYWVQSLLWDPVLIYRLYKVTRSRWIVTTALLLLVVTMSCNTVNIAHFSRNDPLFAPSTVPWIIAHSGMTVLTNLFCTGYLAFYLWRANQDASSVGFVASSFMPVIRVLVDSGALYCITTLFNLMLVAANNNVNLIFFDLIMPITNISFCLIILRLVRRRGKTQEAVSSLRFREDTQAAESSRPQHSALQFELSTMTSTAGGEDKENKESEI